MDHEVNWAGPSGTAVLRSPDHAVSAGVVLLHGAADGRARQPLFDHLASTFLRLGVAVLSYDRRQPDNGGDTPLRVQAADATEAMHRLSDHLGVLAGLFGFSQGAWAAALAAADPATRFLIVLGCSGVSPADQMRYYTDELLRRRGYSLSQRQQLAGLRAGYEDHLRRQRAGDSGRDGLTELLAAAAVEPWFEHAYLPASPPSRPSWPDMDFDPRPSFTKVCCPVLAIWGSDEECVPLEPSRNAWRASGADVAAVELPGCGHWPAIGSGNPDYAPAAEDQVGQDLGNTIIEWLGQQLHGHQDHEASRTHRQRRRPDRPSGVPAGFAPLPELPQQSRRDDS